MHGGLRDLARRIRHFGAVRVLDVHRLALWRWARGQLDDEAMMQLIVSGSRYATEEDRAIVWRELDWTNEHEGPIELLIEGGARGVDLYASRWALAYDVKCVRLPADWKHYGKAAGHIRNREMLTTYPGARVLAFPKALSPGTRGCIAHARELGRDVRVVELKP